MYGSDSISVILVM